MGKTEVIVSKGLSPMLYAHYSLLSYINQGFWKDKKSRAGCARLFVFLVRGHRDFALITMGGSGSSISLTNTGLSTLQFFGVPSWL